MHAGQFVFSQLMDYATAHEFDQCVDRYHGNSRVRDFTCWDQFLCMAFAQLQGKDSLRDIEICLRAVSGKLYHAGIRAIPSKSTLADANESRDWRIYADFAQVLIRKARTLYARDEFDVALEQSAYAFDSTTIDLCLALYPWAQFRRYKAAIKLHTLLDLRGNLPCFIRVSEGKLHDVNSLDDLLLETGAFYMFDRGYTDFARLYKFTEQAAFFVTRAKSNLHFARQVSRPTDLDSGLRSDQTIRLTGSKTSRAYPAPLRRVGYFDAERNRKLVFLSNNFRLPARVIAHLYRLRWRVELFFKWIKQPLHIKAFYGTSENAVKTQVWIAVAVYAIVALVRKRLGVARTPTEILQIFTMTLFDKVDIQQALATFVPQNPEPESHNQLLLFKF